MHKTGASSLKEQKISFSAYMDSGVLLGTVVKQIEALINSIKDVKKGCKGSHQFAMAGFMDDKKGSIFLAMTKPEKLRG